MEQGWNDEHSILMNCKCFTKILIHENCSLNAAWMYDWSTNEWITDLTPMTLARHGHSCGVRINSAGDEEFVVVGGVGADSSTEIYSIQDNTWTDGPQYYYEEFRYLRFRISNA